MLSSVSVQCDPSLRKTSKILFLGIVTGQFNETPKITLLPLFRTHTLFITFVSFPLHNVGSEIVEIKLVSTVPTSNFCSGFERKS